MQQKNAIIFKQRSQQKLTAEAYFLMACCMFFNTILKLCSPSFVHNSSTTYCFTHNDLEGIFTGRTFTSMTIPSLWVFVLTITIAVIMYGFDHILDFCCMYLVFVTIFMTHIIITYGSVITGYHTNDAVVLDTVALEAVILVVVVVALLNEILNHHLHICRGV
jgi:hypothetical protein